MGRVESVAFKREVEIEKLLQWAYLDELPKRLLNAQGDAKTWDRLAQYGSLGGIDVDETVSAPQRYAYVGEPHRDALAIEGAVNQLGATTVDWGEDFELIAWDLAALLSINVLQRPQRRRFADGSSSRTAIEQTELVQYRKGAGARLVADDARDVIAIASTNVTALVHMHAINRSRPFFNNETPKPSMIAADRGRGAKLIGECKGKNLYETGSFCPLSWWPSPLQVALDRAEYLLWHRALTTLADQLVLAEHEAQKPDASPAPWIKPEISRRTFRQAQTRTRKSQYDVQRPRAGSPPKKPKHSKVRSVPFDSGANC